MKKELQLTKESDKQNAKQQQQQQQLLPIWPTEKEQTAAAVKAEYKSAVTSPSQNTTATTTERKVTAKEIQNK